MVFMAAVAVAVKVLIAAAKAAQRIIIQALAAPAEMGLCELFIRAEIDSTQILEQQTSNAWAYCIRRNQRKTVRNMFRLPKQQSFHSV